MWPFRRNKPRRVEVSRSVFAGHELGVWFHTRPNPGIRFPLEEMEKVSVVHESNRNGIVSVTVVFAPADDVIEDLVRSAVEMEITRDGKTFVRLPIMNVSRGDRIITVRAHDEESRA